MKVIFDYTSTNYITLLILATILVMIVADRKNNIKGTNMVYGICYGRGNIYYFSCRVCGDVGGCI